MYDFHCQSFYMVFISGSYKDTKSDMFYLFLADYQKEKVKSSQDYFQWQGKDEWAYKKLEFVRLSTWQHERTQWRGGEKPGRVPSCFCCTGSPALWHNTWFGCAITLSLTYLAHRVREVSHCSLSLAYIWYILAGGGGYSMKNQMPAERLKWLYSLMLGSKAVWRSFILDFALCLCWRYILHLLSQIKVLTPRELRKVEWWVRLWVWLRVVTDLLWHHKVADVLKSAHWSLSLSIESRILSISLYGVILPFWCWHFWGVNFK